MKRTIAGAVLLCSASCGRLGFDTSNSSSVDATVDAAVDAAVEVCEQKIARDLVGGVVAGSTTAETDLYAGSCGGSSRPEAVYAIVLDRRVAGMRIAADLPGTTYDTLLYVRDACDDATSELACDLESGSSNEPQVRLGPLDRGTYFAFVDGDSEVSGDFELEVIVFVETDTPCDPANLRERCLPGLQCVSGTCQPAACTLAQTLTGDVVVVGSTAGASNFHAGTCGETRDGGERAPEVFFGLTLASDVSNVNLSTDSDVTEYDTLIYLRSGCNGAEIACDDDSGTKSLTSVLDTGPLTAGDYVVVVDGFSNKRGQFELKVTVTP